MLGSFEFLEEFTGLVRLPHKKSCGIVNCMNGDIAEIAPRMKQRIFGHCTAQELLEGAWLEGWGFGNAELQVNWLRCSSGLLGSSSLLCLRTASAAIARPPTLRMPVMLNFLRLLNYL